MAVPNKVTPPYRDKVLNDKGMLEKAWEDFFRALKTYIEDILIPAGTIFADCGSETPFGYERPYGQLAVRADYPRLFARIGTTYNTGSETDLEFRFPDLRGRVIAGKDDMGDSAAGRLTDAASGVDGLTLGADGGSETHSLTEDENAEHTHIQNSHFHGMDTVFGGAGALMPRGGATSQLSAQITYNTDAKTAVNQNSGSSDPHNNVQPTLVLNFIMKV